MLETTEDIIGLDIYGPKGIFVGKVDDLAFDTDNRRVIGLMVRNCPNSTERISTRWCWHLGPIPT